MATATTVAVCTGRLGSLVLTAPATVRTRRRLWRMVLGAGRILAIALLPPLVLGLLYGIPGRDATGKTIVGLGALWGLVVLMTALDPQFKERVSTMKELLGMLVPNRKE